MIIPIIIFIIAFFTISIVIFLTTIKKEKDKENETRKMLEQIWIKQLKMLELDIRIANDRGYFQPYER